MKFSQKTEYALRAMVELGKRCREGGGPTSARGIAESQKIPLRFLEQVLQELKRGGFIKAQRGPAGGCWLARDDEEITVGEIVELIEGQVVAQATLDPFDEQARAAAHSAIQELWLDLQITLRDRLSRTTLADLVRRQDELDKSSYLMFHI
jgi:Rrf2 family protein